MEKVGDKVKEVLSPAVKLIDKVAGTDIEHCESCDRIRELLNNKEYMEAFRQRFGLTAGKND